LRPKKQAAADYINPEKAVEAKERGNALFKEGKFSEAEVEYADAIKRDPTNAVYHCNRGAALTKLMDMTAAQNALNKAVELDPKYAKAWTRKATVEYFCKEYHKAMKSYQTAMDLEPANEEAKAGYQRTIAQVQQGSGGEVDKERAARGMADPEIQSILRDPMVQSVLQDFQENPQAAQQHLSKPEIMSKIEKLIAAGVLQTK